METWWIWAGAGALFAFLLFVPIRVGFRVRASAEDVRVQALYNFGGPIKGSVRIPTIRSFQHPARVVEPVDDPTGSNEEGRTSVPKALVRRGNWALVVSMLRMAMSVFRQVDRLDWMTKLGTGDAAYTSWCTGLLWAVKSGTVSFMSKYVTWLSPPRLQVVPDFERALLFVDLTCIFRFRFGEIILAAISYVLRRLRKGGV